MELLSVVFSTEFQENKRDDKAFALLSLLTAARLKCFRSVATSGGNWILTLLSKEMTYGSEINQNT